MKKIITILGARPQFIKASAISREIKTHPEVQEIIIHTGQHFSDNMSDIFFKELDLPKPKYNLGINNCSHGEMTGRMIIEIEKILIEERPDFVIVYGDTNSTLAGAIATKKLNIKLVHIEAGLRSFNMQMPEETNRILTDRISDYLFCPTQNAYNNLCIEGYNKFNCKVLNYGDVMYDSMLYYSDFAKKPDIEIPDNYVLATIHRQDNTDIKTNLLSICLALNEIKNQTNIILPIHPRTRKKLPFICNELLKGITVIEPVGYLEMLYLTKNCNLVITDSGGLQKEAYFNKKPCIVLRNETEWIELIENKVAFLCGTDRDKILSTYNDINKTDFNFSKNIFGFGSASKTIIWQLMND